MKNDLILLAELLANDDNFALKFASKQSTTEKFELAKSKFNNLNEDEVEKFLAVLQSLEKVNQKLSLEEMEKVSGGVGNNKLKLAALTFLGITLAPMATSGTVFAVLNQPVSEFYSDKINPTIKNAKQIEYYKRIYSYIIKPTIEEDQSLTSSTFTTEGGKEYKFDKEAMQHIKYGEYDKDYAYHKSGGHTEKALDLLGKIHEAKIKESVKENPCYKIFKEAVERPFKDSAYKTSNTLAYEFGDSLGGSYQCKTIFPKGWFGNDNDGERLKAIAKTCIEKGKNVSTETNDIFVANIKGTVVSTVIKNNKVLTVFPLNVEAEDGHYDLSGYLNNKVKAINQYNSVELVNNDIDFDSLENGSNQANQANPTTSATPATPKQKVNVPLIITKQEQGPNATTTETSTTQTTLTAQTNLATQKQLGTNANEEHGEEKSSLDLEKAKHQDESSSLDLN